MISGPMPSPRITAIVFVTRNSFVFAIVPDRCFAGYSGKCNDTGHESPERPSLA
jgi:hypothetical protein